MVNYRAEAHRVVSVEADNYGSQGKTHWLDLLVKTADGSMMEITLFFEEASTPHQLAIAINKANGVTNPEPTS